MLPSQRSKRCTTSRPETLPFAPGDEPRVADPQYFGWLDMNSLIPLIIGIFALSQGDDDVDENAPEVADPSELTDLTCGEIASQFTITTYTSYCSGEEDIFVPFSTKPDPEAAPNIE